MKHAWLAVLPTRTALAANRVVALPTLASALNVQNAVHRVSSTLIAPHAQRVQQALAHTLTLRAALIVLTAGIRHLGYVRSVWHHAS